jgi:hypothetical protein
MFAFTFRPFYLRGGTRDAYAWVSRHCFDSAEMRKCALLEQNRAQTIKCIERGASSEEKRRKLVRRTLRRRGDEN